MAFAPLAFAPLAFVSPRLAWRLALRRVRNCGAAALGATALAFPPTPAVAVSLHPAVLSFTPGDLSGNDAFTGTVGYDLRLARPYTLTALGYYDAEAPGLQAAHPVGLYDATTRALLASVVVPAGEAAPLQNGFRWAPLASALRLSPGDYVLAAVLPGGGAASFDPFASLAEDVVLASGVSLGGRALVGASDPAALVFPDQEEGGFPGFFGPNLAEPVPGPLPLAGALAGLGWSRRLRRRVLSPGGRPLRCRRR
ncbi:MAG: hypothetical protein VKJ05_04295 [Synechococcaceae cyanobacterium]|nr:hypothetical protein [Synechococcaceae cyanobacterium]